ncbi:MAG: RNA polymerase sigma-70 factor [Bacteroidetes Order II. Incertae sedis bacterium]|nr:RNA polymerase sigma-70 factor [Bacteroidetes Order II. bacterium]
MHPIRAIAQIQDPQLLGLRLKNEDQEAFSALFQLFRVPLMNYVWWIVRDEAVTEDIVQEVFIKLWNIRSEIDGHKSIRALLYTIARNLALNAKRSFHQQMVQIEAANHTLSADPNPLESLETSALAEQLDDWIEALPERRREAFRLSRFEGLSHDEIAELMSLSPATVNRHIGLALQTLRDLMIKNDSDWKKYVEFNTKNA